MIADPNRIQQILNNICGNTLKFTHDGTITISTHQDGDQLTFHVQDTGIGIPSEKIDTLLNKFTQADP